MLSFSGFRLEDGSPIYQQIIRYLEQGIAAGTIRDGDGLPSRRVLSAQLGVNPNTVQKACRMLEEAGLITSRSGAKSEFPLDEAAVAAVRTRLMEREAAALVRSLRQMGLTRPEAEALSFGHSRCPHPRGCRPHQPRQKTEWAPRPGVFRPRYCFFVCHSGSPGRRRSSILTYIRITYIIQL